MINYSDPKTSQIIGDYISLYDLLEWAKPNYPSLSETAKDLLRLFKDKNIQTYHFYNGIKPRIEKTNIKISEMLSILIKYNAYYDDEPYDDIPF
ncbi:MULTISPECIES: hypothetical protein [Lonepinella]|uniref:hypothetical protein n=1 Tax=Lonepinella TaxID=53416 RepID=UPI0036DEB391